MIEQKLTILEVKVTRLTIDQKVTNLADYPWFICVEQQRTKKISTNLISGPTAYISLVTFRVTVAMQATSIEMERFILLRSVEIVKNLEPEEIS